MATLPGPGLEVLVDKDILNVEKNTIAEMMDSGDFYLPLE